MGRAKGFELRMSSEAELKAVGRMLCDTDLPCFPRLGISGKYDVLADLPRWISAVYISASLTRGKGSEGFLGEIRRGGRAICFSVSVSSATCDVEAAAG